MNNLKLAFHQIAEQPGFATLRPPHWRLQFAIQDFPSPRHATSPSWPVVALFLFWLPSPELWGRFCQIPS